MVAAGALPPVDRSWLVVAGLTLGVAALRRAPSLRASVLSGLTLGLGYFGTSLAWALEFGVIAWALLAVSQAAFWMPLGWAVHQSRGRRPSAAVAVTAAAACLLEAARSRLLLGGFEWAQPGVGAHGSVIRPAAAIVGSLGLTLLVVALAAATAITLEQPRALQSWRALAATAGVVVVIVSVGAVSWTNEDGELKVAIVQTDPVCPARRSVDCPGSTSAVQEQLRVASRRLPADLDLVIWGEGVLSAPDLPAASERARTLLGDFDRPVLLGVTSPSGTGSFLNRNVLVAADGEVLGAYAKRQPVPFGEYVPARGIVGGVQEVGRLVPRDLRRGTSTEPLWLGGIGLGTVSSWEVTFGRLVRDVATDSAALVTLTSQASYGQAPVSDQLIRAAQLRAAELQRSVIVAATTGQSVVIGPDGSRGATTRLYGSDVLVEEVELRRGATPYARFGDLPVLALAVLMLAGAVAVSGRQPTRDHHAATMVT